MRVTDEFMQAVEEDKPWTTHWVTDPTKVSHYGPRADGKMAAGAWACGDPGVQYDSTINRWHTCPNSGRINASNPCVTGDTLVATADGYRRVRNLVGKSVEITGEDGGTKLVEPVLGNKPVYQFRTRSGYGVRLTANHRVWTLNRGDVPAAELTVDNVVQLQKPGFGLDFVPAAFGELGMAVGDGCLSYGRNQQPFMFVTLGAHEACLAHRLQGNLQECKQWLELEDGRCARHLWLWPISSGTQSPSSIRLPRKYAPNFPSVRELRRW